MPSIEPLFFTWFNFILHYGPGLKNTFVHLYDQSPGTTVSDILLPKSCFLKALT